MSNHIGIGAVQLRIRSKGIASWGYPRIQIGGLSLFTRASNGELHIASYHPRRSLTWLWYVGLGKEKRPLRIERERRSQWHHFIPLGFRTLIIGRQRAMWRDA